MEGGRVKKKERIEKRSREREGETNPEKTK